jgi:hypothetical protein
VELIEFAWLDTTCGESFGAFTDNFDWPWYSDDGGEPACFVALLPEFFRYGFLFVPFVAKWCDFAVDEFTNVSTPLDVSFVVVRAFPVLVPCCITYSF